LTPTELAIDGPQIATGPDADAAVAMHYLTHEGCPQHGDWPANLEGQPVSATVAADPIKRV
jgi:hypothetical protein